MDIGVTAIWLTPFFKTRFRSSGYDITNYFDVHDVFGKMADLKELINNAHKKGINNIIEYKLSLYYSQHINHVFHRFKSYYGFCS